MEVTLNCKLVFDTWAHKHGLKDSTYRLVPSSWSDDDEKVTVLKSVPITLEIPDDFDPRPAQIKALEKKREELNTQFAAAVTELNRQISQLQAIEYTEAA
jgi:hypothetical protein